MTENETDAAAPQSQRVPDWRSLADAWEAAELTLLPPFQPGDGLLWKADLPAEFAGLGDTNESPAASRLLLREDGKALGPRHGIHADISRDGGGRYSHWGGGLFFSTSDGSDPNTNQRRYSLSIGAPTPKLLGFGSCHMHGVLADLHARGRAYRLWPDPGLTYTPGETLQLVEFHLGLLEIPEPVRTFALPTPPGQNSLRAVFQQADLVFLEFGSSIDFAYGPFLITRAMLLSRLLEPIYALGKAEARIAKRWYYLGLKRMNEPVRRESAKQLLDLVPKADLDPVLARDILERTRGCVQDEPAAAEAVRRIRDLLGAENVFILGAHNVFTPDGRPVSWPQNFARHLERICGRLAMPLIQSSRLVAERGVAFSLEPDLLHFTPQFLALLGDEMLDKARQQVPGA